MSRSFLSETEERAGQGSQTRGSQSGQKKQKSKDVGTRSSSWNWKAAQQGRQAGIGIGGQVGIGMQPSFWEGDGGGEKQVEDRRLQVGSD